MPSVGELVIAAAEEIERLREVVASAGASSDSFSGFSVYRRPIPQPRHRATLTGRMYLPSAAPVRGFKAALQAAAAGVWERPATGPVGVRIVSTFARSKSHFLSGGGLASGAPVFPGRNCGDVDNLGKSVMDALTGIAFGDDSQAVSMWSHKRFGGEDSSTVYVDFMGDDPPCALSAARRGLPHSRKRLSVKR
ncbi:Crossover junction endodeoxyribonuclease, RusA-like [uncultured Caudovirales phage]|uniref:Crossover junction endodeoxyribonuclease, RusA-like n=1 Tax=uncultured Caudovirales phage TaxID=2100421 RepID=A0A6J5QKB3_9CAUD|nr:Crossover junction endodeoxyribonuclease, RusA-like [uncultured Caudovirales phage]